MKLKSVLQLVIFSILPVFTYAQVQHGTGLLLEDEKYQEVPVKASNIGYRDPIATISKASLKEYTPEVGNQGLLGTCVGWATTYYARTIMEAVARGTKNKEEITTLAYSPYFTYHHSSVPNNKDCSLGAYTTKALRALVELGAPTYSMLPPGCVVQISPEILQHANENRIKDFNRLFNDGDSKEAKIAAIKRSLVNKNPVVIGFVVEKSLYKSKGVYEPDGLGSQGGHAMCVIGYDDNQNGGAFEVVNSWGKQWGNEGYIWIKYDDFIANTRYAFEMIPSAKVHKKTMSGNLVFKLADGSEMKATKKDGTYQNSVLGWQQTVVEDSIQSIGDYQTARIFSAGTRYRMHVEVTSPGYVYVFGSDSENHNGVLFPHQSSISAYISSQNSEVIIPSARHWFKLNGDIESDFSVILFSEEKIDPEEVKNKLDTLSGNLMDKLYVIFNTKLVSKENVNQSATGIGFTSRYSTGSMVMLVVEIRRK